MRLRSVFVLGLLALPVAAQAKVKVEVYGKCGESIATGETEAYSAISVFQATDRILELNGLEPKPDKNPTYLVAIGKLGELNEPTAKGRKAWGWRVLVDGVAIKDSISVYPVSGDSKIKWTYGYLVLDDAGTGDEDNYEWHDGQASDCEPAKAEPAPAPAADEPPAPAADEPPAPEQE